MEDFTLAFRNAEFQQEAGRIRHFLLRFRYWLWFVIILTALTPLVSYWAYRTVSARLIKAEFFRYVESTAVGIAAQIDPVMHHRLVSSGDETSPEFAAILDTLAKSHRSNPDIWYVNSLVLEGDLQYIVVDSSIAVTTSSTGAELIPSAFMEFYPAEEEEDYLSMQYIRQGLPYTFEDPYTDEFGTFVGSCAPVAHVDGALPTMACVDISASYYLDHLRQLTSQFIPVTVFTSFLSLVVIFSILKTRLYVRSSLGMLERQRDVFLKTAHVDPLTGALNRRSFSIAYNNAASMTDRHEQRFALITMDIDHFKYINDTYGHVNGDIVLVEAVRKLSTVLRPSDYLARMGGEEFALLCPVKTADDHMAIAEKLRETIEELRVRLGNGEEISFTISLGVYLVQPGDSEEEALEAADIALYRAKETGRNRVMNHSGDEEALS